jgi:hypothetical protein
MTLLSLLSREEDQEHRPFSCVLKGQGKRLGLYPTTMRRSLVDGCDGRPSIILIPSLSIARLELFFFLSDFEQLGASNETVSTFFPMSRENKQKLRNIIQSDRDEHFSRRMDNIPPGAISFIFDGWCWSRDVGEREGCERD